MATEGRRKKLGAFLTFLREKCGFSFDKEKFEDRLKLQKYVFIASFFGLNLRYDFNRYIRGPYSPLLAADYYGEVPEGEDWKDLLEGFDAEGFTRLVKEKSPPWLEVAATLLSFWKEYKEYGRKHGWSENMLEEEIIAAVTDIKGELVERGKETVAKIFSELKRAGLMSHSEA